MAPAQPTAYQIDRTAMAAYPSHLLASTSGCRWLMLAAQTAGLANGGWRPNPSATSGLCPPRIATRTLGADAGSVRTARDFTLATLHRWGTAERSHDIAIVASELVTSALRHALPIPGDTRLRRAVRLGLLQPGPCLLCAVADLGTAAPVPRRPGSLAETGRGLHIICTLSDKWGYTTPPAGTGKVIWALFTPRRPARLPHGPGATA
jgi:anti-sigma regulatory factor (Ser/Thr protein kinase)